MTNLQEVLNKYSIQIPIIQRDYAQGRKEKKVLEIRETFLNSILERLEKSKNLHLDFVYGSIKNTVFIPLDGQQRLTTLFLLYWYFGKKEHKDIDFLKKFTYETRASSREFCLKLIRNDFDFSKENLIDNIKDSKWFLSFWENDPTIKSMLVMIESIHGKFNKYNYFNNLNNVTFEFFELEKFGLDDDLYIKMNARGKPLTEFENFKAKFEQFLSGKDDNLKKEFEQKIDNEWTDLFWQFKDTDYLIDNAFMNYFYYISEMLHNRERADKLLEEIDFNLIENIYSNIENIKFLFKALDKLKYIIDHFDNLFSSDEYVKGKINLFEKDINYLIYVINKGRNDRGFSIQKKFILFIVIYYLVDNEIDDNFKNLVRVARNYIERIRNLRRKDLSYTPNFEYRELNKILNIFLNHINSDIYEKLLENIPEWQSKEFKHEIEKAKLIQKNEDFKEIIFKLEDYKYLKGDIHNFLDDNINKMRNYSEYIPEIFNNKDNSLIVRAMLSTGDSRFKKGGTHKINERYYFGKNGYWEIVLTDSNLNKKTFFKKFIESYISNNCDYNKMVHSYPDQDKDWKYYFIKYKEMLEEDAALSKDYNYFAWDNNFDIEKMGGFHLGAFHINPYVRTVALKTNKNYAEYIKGEDRSYIKIEDYIDRMLSLDINWTIKFSKKINQKIKTDLINKFSLVESQSKYILQGDNSTDRIDKAVQFIHYIESWQSK